MTNRTIIGKLEIKTIGNVGNELYTMVSRNGAYIVDGFFRTNNHNETIIRVLSLYGTYEECFLWTNKTK